MKESVDFGKVYSELRKLNPKLYASRWSGSSKARTKNCDNCTLLGIVDGVEWCAYGVGKILEKTERPKRCVLINYQTGEIRQNWPKSAR